MDTHDEYIEFIIKEQADQIKKQIEDGMIYGKKVNMDNINHLMVASYLIGSAQGHMLTCTAYDDVFERLKNGIT